MQNNIVMSFRWRLKKRGYLDVHIKCIGAGNYFVKALEPLANFGVMTIMSLEEMHNWR